MVAGVHEMPSNCCILPQHTQLRPFHPRKDHLSSQPYPQLRPQQGSSISERSAIRCAAAAPKGAVRQAERCRAQDSSEWAQSMGIQSTGLRVAEFAGEIPAALGPLNLLAPGRHWCSIWVLCNLHMPLTQDAEY